MKKFISKSISFILSLLMIFSINSVVFAEPDETSEVSETDITENSDVEETLNTLVTEEENNKEQIIGLDEYEKYFLNENFEDIPEINGKAFVVFDSQSRTYLVGNNVDLPLEPASTTKIMTVLLAIENLKLSDIVTITPEMFSTIPDDYVKLGMTEGEEFTVEDLINAALLKSCNDATLALAIHMGGTEQAFCSMMNERAKELGCKNTNFTTAYGFADPNNLISVSDISLILEQCISYPAFTEISTSTQYEIGSTNKYSDTRVITNANRFISTQQYSYDYYIGGKTGFTDTAGNTIVAAARKNGRTLIGAIFGSDNSETRYSDLTALFEYCFNNFTTVPIDDNEYSVLLDDTKMQIQRILVDTDLEITAFDMSIRDYHTTTAARALTGNSVVVELADVLVSPSETHQEFDIPLYRRYNDGVTYVVGTIHLVIDSKERSISITPEKKASRDLGTIKNIIITIISACFLGIILILSILYLRKKNLKRREKEFRNKSRML